MADEEKIAAEPVTAANGPRHRKRFIIPTLLLFVIAVLVAFYWYFFLRGYISTDDALIDCDPITVSAKMLGRITALNVGTGDTVQAAELLVQLDDSDLRAQEAQAQADLDFERQSVEVARITVARARDDFARDSVQFGDHAITREQLDHSRSALELARAQQAVAISHVKASEAKLGVIETNLNNTKVYADGPGVVARKWVVPGDIVQPGQPIFTLFDLNDVWVTAYLEETKLAAINPGDSVEISVDAFPNRKFMGVVDLIGAAAASKFSLIPPNNASGNFTKITQRVPIKVVFADQQAIDPPGQPALLPGMSVEVKIRATKE